MNDNASYGLVADQEDPTDVDYSESRVVNITDEVVTFQVATTPGSPARKYRLAPFGRDGSSVSIQSGYAKPYKGAGGHHMLEPIIERKTKRHVWPAVRTRKDDGTEIVIDSPQLAMVVREDRAEAARSAWLNAMARKPRLNRDGSVISDRLVQNAAPIAPPQPTRASAPSPAPVPAKLIGEEVGDDELEEPPPDPDDPIDPAEMPVVGAVDAGEPPPDVPTRAKRGGRG